MKAKRKKYGKQKWERTPLAVWWKRECKQRAANGAALSALAVMQGQASIGKIRMAGTFNGAPMQNKKAAIAQATVDTMAHVANVWKQYGSPLPKNHVDRKLEKMG
jgi:hypothetical protein